MSAYQTEKFKLSAGPCAADGYWVTIQGGMFYNSQGTGFPVPGGHTLEGDWGASGTSWVVGDEMQTVPERLKILWFSYAEDKFYEGDFALPQEKLYHLLQAGTWDIKEQKKVTYTEFTVCVLPKGVVVVWLTGGNKVLVGRFLAHEIIPSPADYQRYYGPAERTSMVKETQAEMPPEVQAQIKAGTISTKKWDDYLLTYPWQVAFNVPFPLYRFNLTGLNAERFTAPLTQDLAPYRQFITTPTPKPVPRKLYLYGTAEHGGHYVVRVRELDKTETQAAFQALHRLSPASPITLLFTLDKPFQKATLTLKNEAKEIPLTKSKIEVLSED
ncbi:DUF2931 family protein [Hymenobacter psoromatis]|uniref:DUF2931 family protein n=1 Tax=Hymenobacter psoromatis TaxID=1484116 RepID=UPI001CBFE6D1|nr:DUF2931 family protein [Hymenobacter psoromatis]